jgi:hypothetical protein
MFLSNGYSFILSPVVKRPGHEADHSSPTSAEVKNDGSIPSHTRTPQCHMGMTLPFTASFHRLPVSASACLARQVVSPFTAVPFPWVAVSKSRLEEKQHALFLYDYTPLQEGWGPLTLPGAMCTREVACQSSPPPLLLHGFSVLCLCVVLRETQAALISFPWRFLKFDWRDNTVMCLSSVPFLLLGDHISRTVLLCLYLCMGWSGTECTITQATYWHIAPTLDDGEICEAVSGMNERQGKPKYLEESCPSAALSITDPTWPDLGSNPGRYGGKPATNCLSYGKAFWYSNSNNKL